MRLSFILLIAVAVIVMLGGVLYVTPFGAYLLTAITGGPDIGAPFTPLVRHSGESVHCYDDGSQYCERQVQPNLEKEQVLGYAFFRQPPVQHKVLYSCAPATNRIDESYDVTTDTNECRRQNLRAYRLGYIFERAEDVPTTPVPLYRCKKTNTADVLLTDTADECQRGGYDASTLLGYIATAGHQSGWTYDALCESAASQCAEAANQAVCAVIQSHCTNPQLAASSPNQEPAPPTAPTDTSQPTTVPSTTPDPTSSPAPPPAGGTITAQRPAFMVSQNRIENAERVEKSLSPHTVSLGNGRWLTAWAEYQERPGTASGNFTDVKARVYTAGQDWGEVVEINPPTVGGQEVVTVELLHVASDKSGNAFVFWKQATSGDPKCGLYAPCMSLYVRHYAAGSGWSEPHVLHGIREGYLGNLSATFTADGAGLAVWTHGLGTTGSTGAAANGTSDQMAALWRNGSWNQPERVAHLDNASTWGTAVTTGNTSMVIWTEVEGGQWDGARGIEPERYHLKARQRAANGTWQEPVVITSTDFQSRGVGVPSYIWYVEAANNSAGHITVIWTQFVFSTDSGRRQQLHAARFVPDQGWTAPKAVENLGPSGAFGGQIAMTDSGTAIAMWDQTCDQGRRAPGTARQCTYFSTSTDGTTWSEPTALVSTDGQASLFKEPARFAALAATGNTIRALMTQGDSLTMYERPDNGDWRRVVVFDEVYRTNASFGSIQPTRSSLVVDSSGNVMTTWMQSLYRAAGVYAPVIRGQYFSAAELAGQTASACGNGLLDSGEQCDNGTGSNDDGCSNQCQLVEDTASIACQYTREGRSIRVTGTVTNYDPANHIVSLDRNFVMNPDAQGTFTITTSRPPRTAVLGVRGSSNVTTTNCVER